MNIQVKCLVTGGAGFIGSHLSDSLIKKGHKVICIDNFLTGSRNNVAHLIDNRNFELIEYDLTESLTSDILKKISGVKYIFHLASPASPPQYQKYSIPTLLVNSIGTNNMLKMARNNDATFLLASTSEVYGNPLVHPQSEKYYGNVNPIGIRACYDESKRFAESLTMEYFRKFQIKSRVIRIFNTYGPRMEPDDGRVVSNFINQAMVNKPLTLYGDGLQTRSFCYVDDLVRGILLAVEKDGIDGEVINLGNPQEKKIIEIGRLILKLMHKTKLGFTRCQKPQDDPERRKPDISKAQNLLSWKPTISLLDGLTKTIAYFQSI